MRISIPVRWLLLFAALAFAVLLHGGIYQITVVTVPGGGSEAASVVAYRLNRFTGSLVVCDTEGCDAMLGGWGGWLAPAPKTKRDEATADKAM